MPAECNPSFEDIYPINEDALYEDFRDSLVLFIDRIENLFKNALSVSSVYEYALAHQKLCSLGMPKEGIFPARQRRAWKKMLKSIDTLDFVCDIQHEAEAHSDQLKRGPVDELFYVPPDVRYENGKPFKNWREHKDYIQESLKKVLPESKILWEMLDKTQDNDSYIPFTKAIKLSNGILTRKKLEKAIQKGEPIKVRSYKPRKQRLNVHIKDVLALIEKFSTSEAAAEEAARIFSVYQKEFLKKQPSANLE